jgi:hypothetical protein
MKITIVVIGAVAVALGTWFAFPTAAPIVVGAGIGLTRVRRPAAHAALAGLAGWGSLLALALLRGDALGILVTRLSGAMDIPAWSLPIATLAYPALLAGSAAWLSRILSPRAVRRPHGPPDPAAAARQRTAA